MTLHTTHYHRLITNTSKTKFLHTTTTIPLGKPSQNKQHLHKKRKKTQLNTNDYNRSLRRSFARAKLLSFFNPDLTHFITLTYQQNQTDHKQTQHHFKQFIKYQKNQIKKNYSQSSSPSEKKQQTHTNKTTANSPKPVSPLRANTKGSSTGETDKTTDSPASTTEKSTNQSIPDLKYIYVYEYQKRGAIHIHMIANGNFITDVNQNGYQSLKYWKHGFTSVLTIDKTDHNFKPYLYLFKYMHKAERIGDSFIHTSRNFDKTEHLDYALYIKELRKANILFKEDIELTLNGKQSRITKEYYETLPDEEDSTKKG